MYTYDITQIITHPSSRNNFIRLATHRAIEEISKFEESWKIKTNINKFLIIPATRIKPGNPNLRSTNVDFAKEGYLLGLKITNTGTSSHVKERTKIAGSTLTKLKRFSGCSEDARPTYTGIPPYSTEHHSPNILAQTTSSPKQSHTIGERSKVAKPSTLHQRVTPGIQHRTD